MPDWVHVWWWLRFLRDPQVMTPLPQQGINPEAMSMDSFDLYEVEWREVDAPRASTDKILVAMGADPYDDDIPF